MFWTEKYGWLVSNTADDYLQANCSKNLQIEIKARPVNASDYMAFKYCFSFATDLAANFGCYRFRIMPDIVSKLLRASI